MMDYEGGVIRLFSILSRLTLTNVEIEFDDSLSKDQVLLCLKRLNLSARTLKRLSFAGEELVNFSGIVDALNVASCCPNLESFEYLLEENLRYSRGLASSDSEDEEDYDYDNYYESMMDTQADEAVSIHFDETEFKCAPKEINLKISSQFADIWFGKKAQLFRKAEKIKIKVDESEGKKNSFSQSELVAILNSSKNTLKEFVLETYDTSINGRSKIEKESIGSKDRPIHLPNLEVLQLPSPGWTRATAETSIHILAPQLDWEEVEDTDVVLNAGKSSTS